MTDEKRAKIHPARTRRLRLRIDIAPMTFTIAALTVPALIEQVSSPIEQEPALRAHVVKFFASYRLTGFLAAAVRDLQYDALMMLCYEEFESRVLVPLVYGRALRLRLHWCCLP